VASEFDLIRRHFTRPTPGAVLGVGDDAALLRPAAGMELAISTDLLVAGTHFFADTDPRDLGWKTLAVNVSDLAAMGAQPRWATLGLTLPAADDGWLAAFAAGFFECADTFGVELIGGDTTRGPLALAITILGEVPAGQALRRDRARAGDTVWVSGQPGHAALGLQHLQGRVALDEPARSTCLAALHRPQPRLALGLALRGIASAAIDISDGLLGDLRHILQASGLAAEITYPHVADPERRGATGLGLAQPHPGARREAVLHETPVAVSPAPTFTLDTYLAGGDDYELLFTASEEHNAHIHALGQQLKLPLTRLGQLVAGEPGHIAIHDAAGQSIVPPQQGYDHFR
jgi:thiamine-monophosphate kinase